MAIGGNLTKIPGSSLTDTGLIPVENIAHRCLVYKIFFFGLISNGTFKCKYRVRYIVTAIR